MPVYQNPSRTGHRRSAPDAFTAPDAARNSFLDGSEKAAAQWELERRFRVFEAKF